MEYTHRKVLNLIGEAQDADKDQRSQAREARVFLDKKDGQWEQHVVERFRKNNMPRYTFDKCNPIVNQISGELKKADFDIKIKPAGSDATEDKAKVIDGMVRKHRKPIVIQ